MMLTKANSDIEAKMKTVIPKNQISLAFMYDTFGRFLDCPDDRVMKVSIVDVPDDYRISINFVKALMLQIVAYLMSL